MAKYLVGEATGSDMFRAQRLAKTMLDGLKSVVEDGQGMKANHPV
jgi:hypothetical protein